MNEDEKIIQDQFNKLPPQLQEALKSTPWKSMVNEISLLKTLSLAQVESIERETMFILYGFENPNDYAINIMREAEINEATATAIAEQVDEKILKVIAEKIDDTKGSVLRTLKESKEDAMRRLIDRREQTGQKASIPEIAPEIHPMIEKGEVAHTVPHVEQSAPIMPSPTPQPEIASPKPEVAPEKPKPAPSIPHYSPGQDPYREPLQ